MNRANALVSALGLIDPAGFWARAEPELNTGCLLWSGSVTPLGYGRLYFRRAQLLAHRLSWALVKGRDPGDLCICHRCDTPSCINPAHLVIGTHADNAADRHRKGRSGANRGPAPWNAKLTEDDVSEIKTLLALSPLRLRQIAEIFGVSTATIGHISTGHQWKRV